MNTVMLMLLAGVAVVGLALGALGLLFTVYDAFDAEIERQREAKDRQDEAAKRCPYGFAKPARRTFWETLL